MHLNQTISWKERKTFLIYLCSIILFFKCNVSFALTLDVIERYTENISNHVFSVHLKYRYYIEDSESINEAISRSLSLARLDAVESSQSFALIKSRINNDTMSNKEIVYVSAGLIESKIVSRALSEVNGRAVLKMSVVFTLDHNKVNEAIKNVAANPELESKLSELIAQNDQLRLALQNKMLDKPFKLPLNDSHVKNKTDFSQSFEMIEQIFQQPSFSNDFYQTVASSKGVIEQLNAILTNMTESASVLVRPSVSSIDTLGSVTLDTYPEWSVSEESLVSFLSNHFDVRIMKNDDDLKVYVFDPYKNNRFVSAYTSMILDHLTNNAVSIRVFLGNRQKNFYIGVACSPTIATSCYTMLNTTRNRFVLVSKNSRKEPVAIVNTPRGNNSFLLTSREWNQQPLLKYSVVSQKPQMY